MKFRLQEAQENLHNMNVDAIYIYDDANEFIYADDLNEGKRNTLPDRVVLETADVSAILDSIKKCDTVFVLPRPKNNSFIAKYKLTAAECKEIINQLTIQDYVYSSTSINSEHEGNNLIVFEKEGLQIDDQILSDVIIYIKIDIDESTETTVVAVSFHETSTLDEKPYKEEEDIKNEIKEN